MQKTLSKQVDLAVQYPARRLSAEQSAERAILITRLRYENHTLREIGRKFDLTREAVRQILSVQGVTATIPRIRRERFKPKPFALFRQAFWDLVDIHDEDKCWPWMGNRIGPFQYGRFSWRRRTFYAHRLAYVLFHHTSIQNCALHHCDTPHCVNPYHIYEGTYQDNMNDQIERNRAFWLTRLE